MNISFPVDLSSPADPYSLEDPPYLIHGEIIMIKWVEKIEQLPFA